MSAGAQIRVRPGAINGLLTRNRQASPGVRGKMLEFHTSDHAGSIRILFNIYRRPLIFCKKVAYFENCNS